MNYMMHMLGQCETKMEEAVLFGKSRSEIRASEDYKDFKDDGFKEEGVFSIVLTEGMDSLPSYIIKV